MNTATVPLNLDPILTVNSNPIPLVNAGPLPVPPGNPLLLNIANAYGQAVSVFPASLQKPFVIGTPFLIGYGLGMAWPEYKTIFLIAGGVLSAFLWFWSGVTI